jgi:hypothetical protein
MHIPKPPKTEKKQPKPIKHTAIVRKASWKPLKRSSGAAAALVRRTLIARARKPLVAKTGPPKRRSPIARCNVTPPSTLPPPKPNGWRGRQNVRQIERLPVTENGR